LPVEKSPTRSPRRPRSDGERNRLRLIEAAKSEFVRSGSAATLDQIARAADVGIGTLYRHFPTRDALIEAVYRQETDRLIDAAARLMAEREAMAALREWLLLFVDFLDAKQGMAAALDTLIDGPDALYRTTPSRLAAPIGALVDHAARAGTLRSEIEPLDLLRAIAGVAKVRHAAYSKDAAVRMVDLLLRGMQA